MTADLPVWRGVRSGGTPNELTLFMPPAWTDRAQCRQTDGDAFFPEKGGSTKHAKAICARCEVQAECLEDALERDEPHGVFGGLSDRERRALKGRGRRRSA